MQWFHRCLEHSLKGKPGGQYRMSAVFTYKNSRQLHLMLPASRFVYVFMNCEQLINKVGIRRIVYSTHRGQELILEERFI